MRRRCGASGRGTGRHARDHVDLVFANAAIGGAGSFVNGSRAAVGDRFAVDWWGV